MSKTVTIGGEGGAVVITKDDDGATMANTVEGAPGYTVGVHSDRPLDGASFMAGLMLGALLYFIIQTAIRWHARREARGHARAVAIGPQGDDTAAHIAALAKRTAALETIVTDPAHRTAREIEALR